MIPGRSNALRFNYQNPLPLVEKRHNIRIVAREPLDSKDQSFQALITTRKLRPSKAHKRKVRGNSHEMEAYIVHMPLQIHTRPFTCLCFRTQRFPVARHDGVFCFFVPPAFNLNRIQAGMLQIGKTFELLPQFVELDN